MNKQLKIALANFAIKPSNQQIRPETGATVKSVENPNSVNNINPLGTWSINQSKSANIKFYNFIRYDHWKYSPYCCDVNIEKYIANIGHEIFGGYWNSSIYPHSFFPNHIGLCRDNIADHGEYHFLTISSSGPLSGCTKITIDVIDKNHLDLHSPAGVMYLTRENETKKQERIIAIVIIAALAANICYQVVYR